jgi:hypothetical protein
MTSHQILNPADHGTLRIHTGLSAALGDVMACITVPAEFRQVQAHCPIVFRRDDATGAFSALALFGFVNGENLFLNGDHWDAGFRPAAMAIQPFWWAARNMRAMPAGACRHGPPAHFNHGRRHAGV